VTRKKNGFPESGEPVGAKTVATSPTAGAAADGYVEKILPPIRNVDRLIVRETDSRRLTEGVCAHLTKAAGHSHAWIALLDAEGKVVVDAFVSGLHGAFGPLRERLGRGEFPACMRRALEGEETVVLDRPQTQCLCCPLSNQCAERAAWSRRLHFDGRTYGTLTVAVSGEHHRDREELDLFEKLADDLAFALRRIEAQRLQKETEERLRASEEKFAKAFLCSPDAFVLTTVPDGRIVEVNAGFTRLSGYAAQEATGRTTGDLGLWVDPAARDEYVALVRRDGWVSDFEASYRTKTGGLLNAIISGTTIHTREGGLFLSIVRDITERRRVEDAQCENERYVRTILEATAEGFWILDREGRIVEVNDAYCAMSGYARNELVGTSVRRLDPDETHEETAARMDRIVASGAEVFEKRHRRKDGSRFPVEVSVSFLRERGGRFVCFCRDLSGRQRREDRIALLGRMLDAAPASITIHDTQGRFLFANRQTAWLHGYQDEVEFLTVNLHDLDVPESRIRLAERFRRIFEEGEARFEAAHYRKDGSTFPLEVLAKAIDFDGRPAVLSIATDITERKRVQEEQEKLRAQLSQAQKMESVGRLAGGVAHDFNNMLGVILGRLEMAMKHADPSHPLHAHLEEIRKAAARSADLTRQLLAFARKQTIAPKVLDLNETVTGMLKMVQRLIGENIELVWKPGRKLWPVKMDPSQIDQILANLCVNARDAIAEVGRLTIQTGNVASSQIFREAPADFPSGEYVWLKVSDTGCGMDEKTLARLYEPFFTTKEKGKGTGLGLATVYGIVRQNKGLIVADSEPGRGTTFRIYLPRHPDETKESPESEGGAPVAGGCETVLLVEDEAAILEMTALMLEGLGYTVLKAGAPGEALRLAQAHSGTVDLLLTDVVMPEMNGRDLARSLLSVHPGIKPLFMSGYTADVISHHGVLDKDVRYVQKPFSMKELAAAVREALEDEGRRKPDGSGRP